MINRWIEGDRLLDTLEDGRRRMHRASRRSPRACSPTGTSTGSLPTPGSPPEAPLVRDMITDDRSTTVRALAGIAARRGQSLAQLALAWALRDPRMTSLVIGASSVAQLEANLAALDD